ncbi:hypothetical protein, partial [Kitasatospora sp. NPDC047058]|uniref:hypothetical protein n=1 Tax=Kitasatospora sp. NPDC047058 TaxID=3155620 RepID=UPI0033CF4633
ALAALREATGLQHRLGNAARTAACLIITGRVHLRFDAVEEARVCFQRAVDTAREHTLPDLVRQGREALAGIGEDHGSTLSEVRRRAFD